MQTDHRRNSKTACKNCRMGVRPAKFGNQRDDALMLHKHRIGGSQIIGKYDLPGERPVDMGNGCVSVHQAHLNGSDDMIDIILARAQVRILHGFEHTDECVALHLESPFGIAFFFANELDGSLGDGGVVQHQ